MGLMTGTTLQGLKNTYSSALYSYFRVTNLEEAYEEFIKDPTKPPLFHYSDNMSLAVINKRLKKLHEILAGLDPANQAEIAFVEWRLAESLILQEFRKIYENGGDISPQKVNKYIADQMELYGDINLEIFGGVIRWLRVLANRRGPEYVKVMAQIQKRVGEYPDHILYVPKEATFLHYKRLFADGFPELHAVLSRVRRAEQYSQEELVEVFEKALSAVDATQRGWRVVISSGGANVISAKYRQKVIIGSHYQPSSTPRLKQVVAHEIGAHVQRAISDTAGKKLASFDENDEGLAVVVEQLYGHKFSYKRAQRYLAVCLAVGADGQKRNFSEVYDILWRAFYIASGDKKGAKKRAFYETARAFRGGIPAVPGMVYIKDKIYLEGNLIVWEKLEENLLGQREFRQLFKGHNDKVAKEIVP